MLVSHSHKFIFIAIPRTGSTSIRYSLQKYLHKYPETLEEEAQQFDPHITASSVKDVMMQQGYDWNEYFKFTFVRNPWDRILSKFLYCKEYLSREIQNKPYHKDTMDFCKALKTNDFDSAMQDWRFLSNEVLKKTQLEYLINEGDKDNKLLVDYVGKFETLQDDYNIICERIGLSSRVLDRLNVINHANYREYYTPLAKRIVENTCSKEIVMFNYNF